MNRMFYAALVAAAAILAASCGANNGGKDNADISTPDDSGIESVVFSLSYSVTEDVLRIADVKVESVGADGTAIMHEVGKEGWKCDLTASELPATVSFRPVYSLLDDTEPADSYRVGSGYSVSVMVKDAYGQHVVYSTSSPTGEMTIKADRVAEWVARQNENSRAHSYTVDPQGNVQAQ